MKIRASLFAVVVVSFLATLTVPAEAMGSSTPFQDAQVGLHYLVYQPTYNAGMTLKNFGMHQCGAGDLAINVNYGSGKKSILLTESSMQNICPLNMMLIRGATRTVVNLPGTGSLGATQVATISVGIPRALLNRFFSHLKARYIAPQN